MNLVNTREGVHEKWEYRCVSTTIGWRVARIMEMGEDTWCDKTRRQVFAKNHLHVELTWLSYILLFVGCQTKGYLACPLCGLEVDTRRSSHLKKKKNLQHQCYLAKGHPYRRDNVAFNGQMEIRYAPPKVSTIDFLRMAEEWEVWLARKKLHASEDRDQDPIHTHGVKRKNIFFFLPYWQVCLFRFPNGVTI